MPDQVWCLDIFLSGHTLKVHGDRAALQPGFDLFMENQWDENTKIYVKGFCNTADRAELNVAVKLEKVEAMNLFQED